MCQDILSENKSTKKDVGRLTFDLLKQSLTCSSLFSSTVGIRSSLYIENIHRYCTRNYDLFMSHNDLDVQTGDLKLYVCLSVVL